MISALPVSIKQADALSTDYRVHPEARVIEDDRITYSCGCVCEIHESAALRCIAKCEGHTADRRDPRTLERGYFERIGCIVDGIPQCSRYLAELREVLGRFKPRGLTGSALEVGCGCSMYAPALIASHDHYRGVEPSEWAATWTARTFDVDVEVLALEDFHSFPGAFTTILAAHSLEHMHDAPGAIVKCARLLEPGGELWIIIPDESDPLNPDHTWCFSAVALWRCLDVAGLEVCKMEKRRRIERESFLYVRARKP